MYVCMCLPVGLSICLCVRVFYANILSRSIFVPERLSIYVQKLLWRKSHEKSKNLILSFKYKYIYICTLVLLSSCHLPLLGWSKTHWFIIWLVNNTFKNYQVTNWTRNWFNLRNDFKNVYQMKILIWSTVLPNIYIYNELFKGCNFYIRFTHVSVSMTIIRAVLLIFNSSEKKFKGKKKIKRKHEKHCFRFSKLIVFHFNLDWRNFLSEFF